MPSIDVPRGSGSRRLQALLIVLWLGSIVYGVDRIMAYERRPGAEAAAPSDWPAGTRLAPVPGRATLVIFAHPQCPCTRASLEKLAEASGRATPPVTAYAVFARPSGLPSSWVRTTSWDQAAALPGWTSIEDEGGREAKTFGATTSGHVLLYDALGRLRFSGGVTSGRGTFGESAGEESLRALLTAGDTSCSRTPVFGCPLNDPEGDR